MSSFPVPDCDMCEALRSETVMGSVKAWAEKVRAHMMGAHRENWAQRDLPRKKDS